MTYDPVDFIKSDVSTEEVCSKIIQDLKYGNLTVLKLVESLGDLLTSQEIPTRTGGIEILSRVLQQLPTSFLSPNEVDHLVGYFSCCLIEHHSFTPAVLRAFLALMNADDVPDGVASKIFTVMNLHLSCQSQPQTDRFICYQLFQKIMVKKTAELQALGPDFVCGYLSAIDSESDPRNLMYLFENYGTFLKNFPPGHLLEDAFEFAQIYFPVDFRTNANDPRGITREDLSNALMPSLTAIPDFCPKTITLALDKLSSDLNIAKLDSLLLLKRCMDDFPPEKLCPHVTEITSSLLNELKPGFAEANIQELSIDVVSYLMKYLSKHNRSEELNKALNAVILSVKHFLNDVTSSFFPPTIKFLSKIASSCVSACHGIITLMIPKLLAFKTQKEAEILIILKSFKSLLSPCVEFQVDCAEIYEIADLWPQVPEFFLTHCRSSKNEIRMSAIEGIASVVQLFNFGHRQSLFLLLCECIKFEENIPFREKCMRCVCIAAQIFPDELKSIFDSELVVQANGISSDEELRKRIFQCWCAIAPVSGFLSYLHAAVKAYLKNENYEFANFVIAELRKLIYRERNNYLLLKTLHNDLNITKYLKEWWHESCDRNLVADNQIFDDEKTAENIQLIIRVIVRVLDDECQFQLFTSHSQDFMNSFQKLNINEDLGTHSVYSLSIITFEGVVGGLLPTVLEKAWSNDLTPIIKYLSTLAVYCTRTFLNSTACSCIATIFNKLNEVSILDEHVKFVFDYATNVIDKETGLPKKNAVHLHLYMTKSLLLRGYATLNPWLDKLLSLFLDEEVSFTVAEGFKMITTDDEPVLNADCHCQVKLFYRQRLISYIIPKLVSLVKNADQKIKANCAISAIYAMQELPPSVISRYIKEIIPLLVELLDLKYTPDPSLMALQKIVFLLPDNQSIFEEYIEIFLSKFLSLAKRASSMKVRMTALQCLTEFSKLSPVVILPLKSKIVHGLAACIDDHKRLVRQKAVEARTKWIVLGVS